MWDWYFFIILKSWLYWRLKQRVVFYRWGIKQKSVRVVTTRGKYEIQNLKEILWKIEHLVMKNEFLSTQLKKYCNLQIIKNFNCYKKWFNTFWSMKNVTKLLEILDNVYPNVHSLSKTCIEFLILVFPTKVFFDMTSFMQQEKIKRENDRNHVCTFDPHNIIVLKPRRN